MVMAENNECESDGRISNAEELFIQGNSLVVAGKYVAAARAFIQSREAGYPEAPADCSILFDAMLEKNLSTVRQMFQKEADNGNPFAACCNFLSYINFEGYTKDFDLVYANRALRQARKLGSFHAVQAAESFANAAYSDKFQSFVKNIRDKAEYCRIAGDINATGTGCPKNVSKAISHYSAAKDISPICLLRMTLLKMSLPYDSVPKGQIKAHLETLFSNLIQSAAAFEKMSDMPNADKAGYQVLLSEALFAAGKLILHRHGEIGRNIDEAVPLMRRSNDLGNMDARRILGKMLFYGRLVPQDKQSGIRLLDEAYVSGNVLAALDSGLAYYYHGLLQNKDNMSCALERFTMAARNGNAEAWKMIGRMFLKGQAGIGRTGRGRNDEAYARQCFEEAVRHGCMDASYNLARIFYDRATSLDFQKAFQLAAPLAETGHAESQLLAASMLLEGLGVERNPKRGLEFLEKASEQGCSEATWKIFLYYLTEDPVASSPEKVFKLLLKSLEQGNSSAYKFIRRGRDSDHLPVMLKERIFENLLYNLKCLVVAGYEHDALLPFLVFALRNSMLAVPVFPIKKDLQKYDVNLVSLGRSILGSDKEPCHAVIATVPAWKMAEDKDGTINRRIRTDSFAVFSRMEEIPRYWLKKYRFQQIPARKCLEMLWGFVIKNKFPSGIALDPRSKLLSLGKAYMYLVENPPQITQYYVPPRPYEETW